MLSVEAKHALRHYLMSYRRRYPDKPKDRAIAAATNWYTGFHRALSGQEPSKGRMREIFRYLDGLRFGSPS